MDDLRVQDLPAYHHLHPIFGSLFSQLKNLIRSDNSAAMIPTHVFGNVKFFSQVAHCIGLELIGRFGKHYGQGYRMIHVVIENRNDCGAISRESRCSQLCAPRHFG